MRFILVLSLLVTTTSASTTKDDQVSLRGGRDLKGHKGPHYGSKPNKSGPASPNAAPYSVPVPPYESASPQTPQKQHRGHRGKMDVKNSKVEHAKKPNPKRWAHPPARSPTPNPAGQAQSYSYEKPTNGEAVEQDNEHNFRMEVKKGYAKKQNRKHAQNDPPAPSPGREDVPPPPSSTGIDSSHRPSDSSVAQETPQGDRRKKNHHKKDQAKHKHVRKGHDKNEATGNEHVKKYNDKKGYGRNGGYQPNSGVGEMSRWNARMKPQPKSKDHGEKKHEHIMELESDPFSGNVAKENKKKGNKKHKKSGHYQEQETVPSSQNGAENGVVKSTPVPAPSVAIEMVVPAPVTDEPTRAPVTSEPTTNEPTTNEPTTEEPTTEEPTTEEPTLITSEPTSPAPTTHEPTTEIPTYMPTQTEVLPACPPPYDSTKSTYVAGEYAEVQSHIFQCNVLYEEYCNVADWDDRLLVTNPNAKQMWNDAWVHMGPCTMEPMDDMGAMSAGVAVSVDSDASEWQSYDLSSECLLKYKVNGDEGSVSMELVHDGDEPVWLGLAFSETGNMAGSEAVIGLPGDNVVQKYDLLGNNDGAVQPMAASQQTLSDASIGVNEYGETIMKFTKLLDEDYEIKIMASGNSKNIMLFAQGSGESLGYHGEDKMAFELTL